VDEAVINKIIELIRFITNDDIIGEARFNKITEDIRQPCQLPHKPLKLDLPLHGLVNRSLLENGHASGVCKSLNDAKEQIIKLMKDSSSASRKQFEAVVALLN
jgi:hypothetical protein